VKPWNARATASTVATFFAATCFAHHSTAAYNLKVDVVIEGTVQEYHWTNPHSWMVVRSDAPDDAGKVWHIEFGTPSVSVRTGWTPKTFKPGDHAKFAFHPRSDGAPSGVLSVVMLPDGRTLHGMTAPAGPIPGLPAKS
jgi:hypothetical protein